MHPWRINCECNSLVHGSSLWRNKLFWILNPNRVRLSCKKNVYVNVLHENIHVRSLIKLEKNISMDWFINHTYWHSLRFLLLWYKKIKTRYSHRRDRRPLKVIWTIHVSYNIFDCKIIKKIKSVNKIHKTLNNKKKSVQITFSGRRSRLWE
jgi:hypothetical protein